MTEKSDKDEWERRANRKALSAAIQRATVPAPKSEKPPGPTDWTKRAGLMSPGDMRKMR